MKLSDFKVGDKVSCWDFPGYFKIKYKYLGGRACVLEDAAGVEDWHKNNRDDWKLWQEPKRKVWLWSDRNGHVSSHLMDEIEAAKEYESEAKYLPGADVGFFKLPWSETELP